ncbi:MAG: shikimate dehydrogenase [Candidatus Omnitrophica bacterium]|nr:shikimate dehydrogenase [Candidatus Omnitrophota bacterium]MBU1853099.1 shikimate dehydrogenase [Candidatus Omnitrophota bacterium]
MDTYGLIGWPVKHSLSPAMHNAAFEALNIKAEYKLFPVKPEELEDFLLNRKDVKGFNITVPHKVRALHFFLEGTTVSHPHAFNQAYLLADAVNTVKRDGDQLECRNTDIQGFREALINGLKFNPSNKCVFVFGCGGAGRAVIASLLEDGMDVRKIYVYDINKLIIDDCKKHFFKEEFAGIVRQRLEFVSQEQIQKYIRVSELLVNATTVGMKEGDDSSVIDKNLLHKDLSVYDVVYNRETQLIKDAKALGLPTSGGLGMLLYQGASAFEFWTGRRAPVDVMREALARAMK